jgi:cytochrome P450
MSRHAEFPKGKSAPAFRHEELLQNGPAMSAAAEETVPKWRAAPPGATHAINGDMMRVRGGADDVFRAIEKGHAGYYKAVNWWVIYAMLRLPHWLPRPMGRAMRAHEARLRNAVIDLVRTRRANAADGQDFLARLVRARDEQTGQTMSDDLVSDNIVAFLMAGYDTTAFALTWTLYLISQSPEWEARMLTEVEQVAGSGPITAAHVEHLHIVTQVLNESLRLFPSAPLIIRDIVNDLEFGGRTIPAGTIGVIPIYAIHRHRKMWDDPDRFDPSRFAAI